MTTKIKTKSWMALASVALVAACGGSSTSTSDSYDVLTGTTGGTETVKALSLDTDGLAISQTSGTYNYSAGEVTIGSSAKPVNASSVLSLKQGGTTERYSYVAGITDDAGDYRLFAIQTDPDNLPSNTTVTYEGQAIVVVTIGSGTTENFEGTMDSTVTAKFGSTGDSVDVVLTGYTPPTGSSVVVTDNEQITFRGLDISGAGYVNDGDTTATIEKFGSQQSVNTDSATISLIGVFAGNNGTETAGVGAIQADGGTAAVSFSGVQTN